MVILASSKLSIGGIEGFICSSEFKFFGVSQLLELIGSFLCLEEIVVDCLDLSIIILALFFLALHLNSQRNGFSVGLLERGLKLLVLLLQGGGLRGGLVKRAF